MKNSIRSFILTILILSFGVMYVNASEYPVMNVTVTNNSTGEKQTAEIPVNTASMMLVNGEQVLEGEVYVKIPEKLSDSMELMDATTYASTTDTSSNQNVYWKATVSVTYSDDGTYCTFSRAGASWVQLRGTSTLSKKRVYWGCTLGVTYNSKTYYPSADSVTYATGLGAMKYGTNSMLGCNSYALITLQNGLTTTIEANIQKTF